MRRRGTQAYGAYWAYILSERKECTRVSILVTDTERGGANVD